MCVGVIVEPLLAVGKHRAVMIRKGKSVFSTMKKDFTCPLCGGRAMSNRLRTPLI